MSILGIVDIIDRRDIPYSNGIRILTVSFSQTYCTQTHSAAWVSLRIDKVGSKIADISAKAAA